MTSKPDSNEAPDRGRHSRREAVAARAKAQELAFAPFMFHAVCSLRELGIIDLLWLRRSESTSRADVAEHTGLSPYATDVLLDAGVACEVIERDGDGVRLSAVGYYLKSDEMTRVNLEFARDVCYLPLTRLTSSLKEGKPRGLDTLTPTGDADATVYSLFSLLPLQVQRSWLAFDHYYSEGAFKAALPIVFSRPVRRILDVGGNTGRFARSCLEHDAEVSVAIVDHPVQLAAAREHLSAFSGRFECVERDLLVAEPLPLAFDVVWMSQLLDCFPPEAILSLLRRAGRALSPGGRLYVLEPCWDLQPQPAGTQALLLTSLYFACVANGKSRMYDSKLLAELIDGAGLSVVARHDGLGIGQSLFECVLAHPA